MPVFGSLTLARARIVCHFRTGSALAQNLQPRLFDTLERNGRRGAQLLREQRHAELLDQPSKPRQTRRDPPLATLGNQPLLVARPPLRHLRRVACIPLWILCVPCNAATERPEVA